MFLMFYCFVIDVVSIKEKIYICASGDETGVNEGDETGSKNGDETVW